MGDYSTVFYGARIQVFKKEGKWANLSLGNNSSLEQFAHITCGESIVIGDNLMASANVMITDIDHGIDPEDALPYNKQGLRTRPVKIGNNVFIGMGSFIMPGVTIGNNVVIGANSVVNKDIPNDVMVAGSPARPIKRYDNEKKAWVKI